LVAEIANLAVFTIDQAIDLGRAGLGIDEHIVGDALVGVEPELGFFVPMRRLLGNDFNDQLGRARQTLRVRDMADDDDVGPDDGVIGELDINLKQGLAVCNRRAPRRVDARCAY
jgi:hypothetical protein